MMLNHVLPGIKRKMQWMQGQLLFIQQDGAKAHTPALKNEDLLAALKSQNWNRQLVTQPPRSPFSNICDLSFNWSLQCQAESIKYHCDSLEDMKNLVESEFNSYDVRLLKSQWGTLTHMYKLVFKHRGENFGNDELHSGANKYAADHPHAPVNFNTTVDKIVEKVGT